MARDFVKQAVAFGAVKEEIVDCLYGVCPVKSCNTLEEVVAFAMDHAIDDDVVLFSPACASFDMFDSYRARGNAFKSLIFRMTS